VKGLIFIAKIIDGDGKILADKSGFAEIDANNSKKISGIELKIPETMKGKTFFVSAELKDTSGNKISDAFYPIAVSKTGNLEEFNNIFSEINQMPNAALKIEQANSELTLKNGNGNSKLLISNTTEKLAFFARVRMIEESESLRTSYSDNYISLLPGETKSITISLENTALKTVPAKVHFEVSGWNCPAQSIELKVIGK
jgi:hypothetical protein